MPTDTFNYPCWSAILSNKLPLKETCFNCGWRATNPIRPGGAAESVRIKAAKGRQE